VSHKLVLSARISEALPDQIRQLAAPVQLSLAFLAIIVLLFVIPEALTNSSGLSKALITLYIAALVVLILALAYLASSRTDLQRRLVLIEEIALPCNPCFGADRTIASIMEKLRTFYAADSCILIVCEEESTSYRLLRVDSNGWEKALRPETISEELERQLSGITSTLAVAYSRGWQGFWMPHGRYCEIKLIDDKAESPAEREAAHQIATIFEAESFLAVPVYRHDRVTGRLYLVSQRRRAFGKADARHVYQLLARALPVVQYIRRTEELVEEAAERERKIIACDVHDTVIQPYIGIQLVLAALKKKIQRGEPNVQNEFSSLERIIDGEIFRLRRYIAALSGTGVTSSRLMELVRGFAQNLSEASGIAIEVRNSAQMRINDKLAQEAFQMVAEGLSNVRRHSNASRAAVEVACDRDNLVIEIEDEGPEQERRPFVPHSLMTRARAFGGDLRVQQTPRGSEITIKIPL